MVRLDLRHRIAVLLMALSAPLLTGAREHGCGDTQSADGCFTTGCSSELCAEAPTVTACIWKEEYACYQQYGVCARGPSGVCGWQKTSALTTCLAQGGETLSSARRCVVSGCSGQVCAEKPMITTCEWREEYACYQQYGVCARGPDGVCGWQETAALTRCLAEASVVHEPAGDDSP